VCHPDEDYSAARMPAEELVPNVQRRGIDRLASAKRCRWGAFSCSEGFIQIRH